MRKSSNVTSMRSNSGKSTSNTRSNGSKNTSSSTTNKGGKRGRVSK